MVRDTAQMKAMAVTERKSRGEGHERVPEILEAAQRVFAREGFAKMTMRGVAAEAELSTSGVYIYFKNKEAILAAIRDRTFADLHLSAQAAIRGIVDPEQRLRRHLRSYLDYACGNPDGYRLTLRSHLIRPPRPGRPSPQAVVGREAFDQLVRDIGELIHPGAPHDDELTHALAETTWALIHGLSSLMIDVPNFPTSGIETCFEEAVNMVLAGIRTHEHRGTHPMPEPADRLTRQKTGTVEVGAR